MERVSAIICEFNPLHSGHAALLEHAREVSDVLICVMSGNFTQRSECAIFDKYRRAEAAVRMGADLVAELPFPYSSASGEFFALGGVTVGAALGARHFIFGSERGDTDYVTRAADAVESESFSACLAECEDMSSGAAARHAMAMSSLGFELSSNDKLAVQYVLAARRLGVDVSFEAFLRMCERTRYRSATCLREMIFEGGTAAAAGYIPQEILGVYPTHSDVLPTRLAEIEYIHYRTSDRGQAPAYLDGEGGVRERLLSSAAASSGHGELFARAATKRYTDSRLRRAALYELLGVRREDVSAPPTLSVLLASSAVGRRYLSSVRRTMSIELLTKPSAVPSGERAREAASLMRRADELYTLCLREGRPAGEFLRRVPYVGM